MTTAFLILLGGYVLWTMFTVGLLRRGRSGCLEPVAALFQTPLAVMACVYAAREGLLTRALVFPPAWLLGLAVGHALFALSVVFTHGVPRDAWAHFLDLSGMARFTAGHPGVLARFLGISLTEELIYRGAAQPLLAGLPGGHWTAVPAAALLFSLVHDHFYRNSRRESAEFLLFALTLGLLYHVTGSLAVVIVVHTVRNLESACLEYRELLERTGDEESARRALALSISGKPLETP